MNDLQCLTVTILGSGSIGGFDEFNIMTDCFIKHLFSNKTIFLFVVALQQTVASIASVFLIIFVDDCLI